MLYILQFYKDLIFCKGVSNILALSIVSMLADLSTEMMQPILALFLVGSLGASYSFVGLIEGSSDSFKFGKGCIRTIF